MLPYLASSDFLERCIDENKIILKDVMITFHRIMNLVADFIWVKIGLYGGGGEGGQKNCKKKNTNFWHIVSQNFFPVFNTLKQIA